jgi:hypothetical protein
MTILLRFRPVEVSSTIQFAGKQNIYLQYLVRSMTLVPCNAPPVPKGSQFSMPELFW